MQATDRTVYVGNVGKEVDEAALFALFGHCGSVSQIRIAGEPNYETRYAFIEFTTPEEASTALLLDGMMVFERSIKVNMARGGSGPGIVRSNDPDRVQRTIHVGGLPFDEIQEETLAEYFGHVGEVNAVRKSGRFAWVEFATLQAAQQALALDGEQLGNGCMKVSASKTPIHTAGWRAPKFRDPPPPATPKPVPLPTPPPLARPPAPAGAVPYSPGAPPAYGGPPPPYAAPPPYPPPAAPGYGGPRPPPGPPPPQYGAGPPQYAGPPQGPPGPYPPPMQAAAPGGPPPYAGPPPPYQQPPQHQQYY